MWMGQVLVALWGRVVDVERLAIALRGLGGVVYNLRARLGLPNQPSRILV